MADYLIMQPVDFPAGIVNYQFVSANGVEISTKNDDVAEGSSNFSASVCASVFAKVALYKVSTIDIGVLIGTKSSYTMVEYPSIAKMAFSWWSSSVNGYNPGTASSSYSDFYYASMNSNIRSTWTTPTIRVFDTINQALIAMDDGIWSERYPITYHYTNSTVSGPSEAAVGDTVTVSAVPDNNYGITDPASQILVTNNDVAVSYNWNPSTNTITFVMPDPS